VLPKETITVSAQIDAPIWRVYQNWKRLERFPAFVPTVREARWLSKTRLFWREEHEGQEYESTFEITLQLEENSLSWRNLSGPECSGTAVCEAQREGGTRVTLTIHFVPDELIQLPTAVRARHLAFLKAFKKFVEASAERGGKREPISRAAKSAKRH
jgi:uncharacterized membrane protein